MTREGVDPAAHLSETEQRVDPAAHLSETEQKELQWAGWMKQTSKDPVKNKQKFSRKLVALGKYRYITIAKALTGAKTVTKDYHLFDICVIDSSTEALLLTLRDGKRIYLRPDDKKGKDNTSISEIIRAIRYGHSFITASALYNVPGHLTIKVTEPSLLIELPQPGKIIAGGLLESFISRLNSSKNAYVPSALINWIYDVHDTGTAIFDLRTCPGLDSKSDAYIGVNTILAALSHNSHFRVIILKDLQIKGGSPLSIGTTKIPLCSSLLRYNRNITKVVVSGNSGPEIDWDEFGTVVMENPQNSLTHWEFSNTHLKQKNVVSITKGIRHLGHALKSLKLANCKLNDKGLHELILGMAAYGVILPLEELDLSGNNFGELSSAALSTLLGKMKDHWKVRSICLKDVGSMNWTGILPSFKEMLTLETLDLSDNKLDKEYWSLRCIFEICPHLENLSLARCGLTEVSIAAIVDANMGTARKRVNLDLSGNTGSPASLSKSLFECTFSIYTLNLSGCHLKGKGLATVLASLEKSCAHLTELDIGRNLGASSEGLDYAPALASYVINSPQLKRLSVRGGHGCSNRHALWQLFLNLHQNTTLQELTMENNSIGDRIFTHLVEALKTNTGLKVLRMDGNDLTLTGYQCLSAIIGKQNKTLQHIPTPQRDIDNALVGLNKPRANRLREVWSNVSYKLRCNRNGVEVIEDDELGLWEVPLFVEPLAKVPAHLEADQFVSTATYEEKRSADSAEISPATVAKEPPAPSAPSINTAPPTESSFTPESSSPDSAPTSPPPAYDPKIGAGSDMVTAIWAYTPADPTELAFKAGDVIKVLERSEEGWWKGATGASKKRTTNTSDAVLSWVRRNLRNRAEFSVGSQPQRHLWQSIPTGKVKVCRNLDTKPDKWRTNSGVRVSGYSCSRTQIGNRQSCNALNEPWSDHLAPGGAGMTANMPSSCASRLHSAPCYTSSGVAIEFASSTGEPCPCFDGEVGVCFPGDGQPEVIESQSTLNNFVDYTLVKGNGMANFGTIVGTAFTDNTQEVFITAKAGFIFKYNQNTGALVQWLDISNQVHDAGDYGLLSIETSPDFSNNPTVYFTYAVTALYGPNDDENAISYSRLARVTQGSNGLGDLSTMKILIGVDQTDAPLLCSSTHMGGAVAFGHDGTLFVTFGEGGHFDTDIFDFGQPDLSRYPYDDKCQVAFGATKAIGSFRAQSKDVLSGKLLRIDPSTGGGICAGSGYAVLNPYCDGNLFSTRSRIYAMGLRNPFAMNVKPLASGEVVSGPGVPYVADVGLGSFEEMNVVSGPGLNFGWPCWEGPRAMAGYRDNAMTKLSYTPALNRPKLDDGTEFSCAYVYANITTVHPTYYHSRYTANMQGLYGEEYQLDMGYVGNCITGVNFYTGTTYPAEFQNRVFILDYGASWIKTLDMEDDAYKQVNSFGQYGTSIVDLEVNTVNGDICYVEILNAEIHCIKYASSVPPVVKASSNVQYAAINTQIQFSMDGSFDANNNSVISVVWDFGDGTTEKFPNPVHSYSADGTYTVTLTVTGAKFTVSDTLSIVIDGKPSPVVTIFSPTTDGFFDYVSTSDVLLAANVQSQLPVSYYWDIIMVHVNHYHPATFTSTSKNITVNNSLMGAQSHYGLRFNFLVLLTVTDSRGATGTASIRLRQSGWQTTLGNQIPVPQLTTTGYYAVGQFVRFDASSSYDLDLDYLNYQWDFGDGFGLYGFDLADTRIATSHVYYTAGTYTVTLYVEDNWGGVGTLKHTVVISDVNNAWVEQPLVPITPQNPPASFGASESQAVTTSTSSAVVTSSGMTEQTSTSPSTSSQSTTSLHPSTSSQASKASTTEAITSSVATSSTSSVNVDVSGTHSESSTTTVTVGICFAIFTVLLL
ncbi:PKD domain-containing protein [Planoprotostelium fungivorum]|uniref:PKD domain-containing protein n=1 Tax=Planoprotostelium fungivorum TaxID=1890364 RepID=A0A2P6NNS4_9EUKA|nr:PKD domain-containing protein [Planoprotostelium fungivorum]